MSSTTMTTPRVAASIKEHFADLEDPRIDRTKEHQLLAIIAICAVIFGADSWTSVEKFGNAKLR